ncbi:hypothetical protein [Enterococcus bulliens]
MLLEVGDTINCKNIQGKEISGKITKVNKRTAIVFCGAYSHVVRLSHLIGLGYSFKGNKNMLKIENELSEILS